MITVSRCLKMVKIHHLSHFKIRFYVTSMQASNLVPMVRLVLQGSRKVTKTGITSVHFLKVFWYKDLVQRQIRTIWGPKAI